MLGLAQRSFLTCILAAPMGCQPESSPTVRGPSQPPTSTGAPRTVAGGHLAGSPPPLYSDLEAEALKRILEGRQIGEKGSGGDLDDILISLGIDPGRIRFKVTNGGNMMGWDYFRLSERYELVFKYRLFQPQGRKIGGLSIDPR